MSPKKAFQIIAAEFGFGASGGTFVNLRASGISRPHRDLQEDVCGDYMYKPVILHSNGPGPNGSVINILFYSSELMINDASGGRHKIQYCDPNSIERFEELMSHPFNEMQQWVGSPVDYRTGKNAIDALSEVNDNRYWDDEFGSILVDEERWKQAQKYESDTWMKHGLGSADDRDQQHTAHFGNYEIVPKHLHNLVEIGCGPFTQTFNILQGRRADTITLVDPLLNEYQRHPHCRHGALQTPGSPNPPKMMPIPAEEFTGHGFDTAVCINVLEHVRDAKLVMENLVKCLKKGGVLIFHDRVYDGLDITKIYDIGHPIRITSKFLEPFLKQFTPLREYNDYFIGVKES